VEPTLHELVRLTGESASFYAREGDISLGSNSRPGRAI
jgi:hypothetical protein